MTRYYDGARAEEARRVASVFHDQALPAELPPTLGELLELYRLRDELGLSRGEREELHGAIRACAFGAASRGGPQYDSIDVIDVEVMDDDS